MAKIIDWFHDRFGNIIIPKTVTKAIYDENGNPISDYLDGVVCTKDVIEDDSAIIDEATKYVMEKDLNDAVGVIDSKISTINSNLDTVSNLLSNSLPVDSSMKSIEKEGMYYCVKWSDAPSGVFDNGTVKVTIIPSTEGYYRTLVYIPFSKQNNFCVCKSERNENDIVWGDWFYIPYSITPDNTMLKIQQLIPKSYYDGGTTGFIVGEGVLKLCDGTSSDNTSGVIFMLPFGCKSVKFHVEMQTGGYIQYGNCTFDAYMPNVITEGRGRGNYWIGSNDGGDKSIDIHGIAGCFFIGGYKATITNIRAEIY